jgi:hypothetical protein
VERGTKVSILGRRKTKKGGRTSGERRTGGKTGHIDEATFSTMARRRKRRRIIQTLSTEERVALRARSELVAVAVGGGGSGGVVSSGVAGRRGGRDCGWRRGGRRVRAAVSWGGGLVHLRRRRGTGLAQQSGERDDGDRQRLFNLRNKGGRERTQTYRLRQRPNGSGKLRNLRRRGVDGVGRSHRRLVLRSGVAHHC